MSSIFGYTNPDVLSRHQKETPSDGTNMFNGSWVQRMENFKDIKEMLGGYPRVNKTVIPDTFNDFTITLYPQILNLKPVYLVIYITDYQMMKKLIHTVNKFIFLRLILTIFIILINFHRYI